MHFDLVLFWSLDRHQSDREELKWGTDAEGLEDLRSINRTGRN